MKALTVFSSQPLLPASAPHYATHLALRVLETAANCISGRYADFIFPYDTEVLWVAGKGTVEVRPNRVSSVQVEASVTSLFRLMREW
jgi:hypothetical protein